VLSETARKIVAEGSIRVKVKRAGMLQFQTLVIRRVPLGNGNFVELFLDKVMDLKEVMKLSESTGLPVETENGRVFPEGTGAKDFMEEPDATG
jgi:hypothetical protein